MAVTVLFPLAGLDKCGFDGLVESLHKTFRLAIRFWSWWSYPPGVGMPWRGQM